MDKTEPMPFEEHLRLAQDPTTPGATLESVAAHFTRWGYFLLGLDGGPETAKGCEPVRVWRALAANPNTPPRVLAQLAAKLPAEFCANPVAAVLTLEEPHFARWVADACRHRPSDLLLRTDVPAALLGALASQAKEPALREEASLHVSLGCEGAKGDDWREEARSIVQKKARALRGRNRQGLLDLVEADIAPGWCAAPEARRSPLPLPALTGKWRRPLRNPTAADPDAHPDTLSGLARRPHRAVHLALAENPATPAEALLVTLDRFGETPPRRAIARRPDLTPEVAAKLADSRDPVVLRTLRGNGWGTAADGLSPRLRRQSAAAALEVWRHESPILTLLALLSLPPECAGVGAAALQKAAEDRRWVLRLAASLAPKLFEMVPGAPELLTGLADDSNRLVRSAARARLAGEPGGL